MAVYSSCSDVAVKLTAESLVLVFPHAIKRTKSEELKVYVDLFLHTNVKSSAFLINSFCFLFNVILSTTRWQIIWRFYVCRLLCAVHMCGY